MGQRASRRCVLVALVVSGAAATGLLPACGIEPAQRTVRTATGVDGMPRAAASVAALTARYADHRHTHATATIVNSSRGWLVTSNHNMEGAKALTLTLPDTTQVAATVLARAPCDDMALLGLVAKPPGLLALKPAASDHVTVGEQVMALGFPAGVTDATRPGTPKLALASGAVAMTAADVPMTPLLPALAGLLGHHAPVSPGLSGGPLLSADGRMIGLTVNVGPRDGPAPAINMSFATGGTRIAELLRQLTPSGDGTGHYTGWENQHRCRDAMATLAHAVSEPDHQHPAVSVDAGMSPQEHHHG